MHARVTTIQGSPSSTDESLRVVREQVLPQAREIPGFNGLLSLVDRQTGKAMTLTLWESEQAMQASEAAADRLRGQAVGAIPDAELLSVERYEVAIDERAT